MRSCEAAIHNKTFADWYIIIDFFGFAIDQQMTIFQE